MIRTTTRTHNRIVNTELRSLHEFVSSSRGIGKSHIGSGIAVDVVAVETSDVSTAVVTGNTDLVSGSNVVTITVTAEDGTTAAYTFTVLVARPVEMSSPF